MNDSIYCRGDELREACSEAPRKVGICTLEQQLTNELMEIAAMCDRVRLMLDGPRPEDNTNMEGPGCLREHVTYNLVVTREIRERLYRILEALDG